MECPNYNGLQWFKWRWTKTLKHEHENDQVIVAWADSLHTGRKHSLQIYQSYATNMGMVNSATHAQRMWCHLRDSVGDTSLFIMGEIKS